MQSHSYMWREDYGFDCKWTSCKEGSDGLAVNTKDSKSTVWMHFGFVADGMGKSMTSDTVVCQLCKKTVGAKGCNPSNLFSHLRVHHPLQHTKLNKSSSEASGKPGESSRTAKVSSGQMSPFTALRPAQVYDQKGKKWQKLTDSVTHCLSKDMLPIYSIKKEGFRQLLQSFDPQYKLPSRKYYSKTVLKLYMQTRS